MRFLIDCQHQCIHLVILEYHMKYRLGGNAYFSKLYERHTQPSSPFPRNPFKIIYPNDMKPFSLLLALSCAISFASCYHASNENIDNKPITNPCLNQSFPQRLYKIVYTSYDWTTGQGANVQETRFFFDTNNRLDSIGGYQKIRYGASGLVDQVITYFNNAPNQVEQFVYENGRLTKTETNNYSQNGNLNWKTVKHIEWDDQGFIHKTWIEGAGEYTIFTCDACGNVVKSQDFITSDNRENRLTVETFLDTYNPEYLIGLDKIYPGYYSIHNVSRSEIVHWDNVDFQPSPIDYTYEYNSDGLPVKKKSILQLVEYFYE
ncbi:MAG: hypothetical protein WCJ44_33405 [Runella sp.]